MLALIGTGFATLGVPDKRSRYFKKFQSGVIYDQRSNKQSAMLISCSTFDLTSIPRKQPNYTPVSVSTPSIVFSVQLPAYRRHVWKFSVIENRDWTVAIRHGIPRWCLDICYPRVSRTRQVVSFATLVLSRLASPPSLLSSRSLERPSRFVPVSAFLSAALEPQSHRQPLSAIHYA